MQKSVFCSARSKRKTPKNNKKNVLICRVLFKKPRSNYFIKIETSIVRCFGKKFDSKQAFKKGKQFSLVSMSGIWFRFY